jgi:lysophospholipase L1-like esterase
MNKYFIKMTAILIFLLNSIILGCQESEVQEPDIDTQIIADICNNLYPPMDTVITSHTSWTKTNYPKRITKFKEDTIISGDIVMLGNSLTEQGGNWEVRLGQPNVKNRGISGDNTDGVLARLNELLCNEPSMVFIMIGTNDLFTSYSSEKVTENIDQIATMLSQGLPNSRIVVQTIMPLAEGNDKKTKLIAINDLLMALGTRDYELVDTYQEMVNDSGDLLPEFTEDGVHLTSTGYRKWSEFLVSIIKI